jgi:hypothetical protein
MRFHLPSPSFRRPLLAAWLLLLPPLAAGCDPCAGVSVCGDSHITYQGQLVIHLSGEAAAGVRVDFVRTGGIDVSPSELSVVTDELGRFRLELEPAGPGHVEGWISFHPPPPYAQYAFGEPIRLATSRAAGDVRSLGSWGIGPIRTGPRLSYVGELFLRATGQPAVGFEVEFRKLAGPPLEEETFVVTTDANGRFAIITSVEGHGPVYAELRVRPPPPMLPFVLAESQRFTTSVMHSEIRFLGRWGIGSRMAYVGELFTRTRLAGVEGLEVEFRRTGGVDLLEEVVTARVGADGRFLLLPIPAEAGEVEGELTVILPPPFLPQTMTGVRLQGFESESEIRFLGRWGVLPHLSYVGEIVWWDSHAPAEGVEIEFRRTGGIEVSPDPFTTRSGADGRFLLNPAPHADGEVVGELVIRAPGVRERTITGVRLATSQVDGDLRFMGVWTTGSP